MKRLFFFIAKPLAFRKARNIDAIKSKRRKRIIDIIRFINQWDDMPLDFIYNSVCQRLGMEESDYSKNFIHELILPNVDIDKMAAKLP